LFWFYWKSNFGKPKVIVDSKYPCQKMPIRKKGIFPFRVRVFKNRIAVEFHHSLTDGNGALTFLKALIFEYLRLIKGIKDEPEDIFRPNQDVDPEEYEDAYKKNYDRTYPAFSRPSRAVHLPYKLEKKGIYNIITGIMLVEDILKLAKEHNVTLTEFLAAVYIDTIQEILSGFPEKKRKRYMKPIRIMVPVDLRRMFPSKTMRNFVLYVTPGIDPQLGHHSFDEIIKEVYHYMRLEVNDKYINKQIKRNVRGQLHPLVRATPVFVKKLGARAVYNGMGQNSYTGVLTNLGRVTFTETLKDDILDFHFMPAPNASTKISSAIASYNGKLYMSFGRVVKETEVERIFFSKLKKMGVTVKIETN
ncbi:MAG: hypothetical protein ACW96U_12420, partial [Candidatus Heimdallarchaeaceae archaeon]|jgi:NRPS condensation-like uncharacterized protein